MLAMRSTQLPPPIPMQCDLDKTFGTCYRIHDEPFESKDFRKTNNYYAATLEIQGQLVYWLNPLYQQMLRRISLKFHPLWCG